MDPKDEVRDRKIVEIESKLLEQESRLLEHEHRPFRVLYNLFVERRSWPKGDPRRKATLAAFIWRFLTSATTVVVVGGGFMTFLVGALLALHANLLLAKQNRLISVQTAMEESSRRSALVFELSAILDQIDRELREQQLKAATTPLPVDIHTALAPKPIQLTDRTYGRIAALSRSLRPYRYLETKARGDTSKSVAQEMTLRQVDDVGRLGPLTRVLEKLASVFFDTNDTDVGRLTELRSPERGQLLISLLASRADVSPALLISDFSYADLVTASLGAVQLSGAQLNEALLNGAQLNGAEMKRVNLRGAQLNDAYLNGAHLNEADLNGAHLNRAYLNGADLSGATLVEAQLAAAELRSAQLFEVHLDRANLRGADLRWTDLNGAYLDGVNLDGANLLESNLTQQDIYSACVTEATKLPEGIMPQARNTEECRKWKADNDNYQQSRASDSLEISPRKQAAP